MRRLDTFQENSSKSLLVGPEMNLGQSFVARFDGLAGVRVRLFNPKLGGEGQYRMVIVDAEGQVLREQLVSESNVGWGVIFRFDFAPIAESAGQNYVVELKSLSEEEDELVGLYNDEQLGRAEREVSGQEAIAVGNNYMGWGYGVADEYELGEARLNGEGLPGDFEFQTYYQVGWKGYVRDSLVDLGERLKGDVGFLVVYGGLVAGLVWLLVRRMRGLVKRRV